MEAVECGAAALGIILGYYRRWVPLETLRVDTGVSRDGVNAANIVKAARLYGLEAKGRRLSLEEALALPPPFIVFWKFNHFLVVDGADAGQVFLNDPAAGPRKLTHTEFSEGFTGVVLELKPGQDFKPGGRHPSLFGSLTRRLRHSHDVMTLIVLVSLLLVVPGLIVPALLKNFIDYVLISNIDTWIIPLLAGYLMAALLSGTLTWMQQRFILEARTKLAITSAGEFFWHVLRVPVVFYTQRYVGDVTGRVQSCHRLANLLSGPLSTNVLNLFVVVFYGAVMLLYSVPLTLLVAGLSLINGGALMTVNKRMTDLSHRKLQQQAKLSGTAMSGLQAIETLKATGTENDFFSTWSGYQTGTVNAQQSLGAISAGLGAVPSVINQTLTGLVLGVGGLLIINGELTIGGLVAFQALMGNFTGPVQRFVSFGAQLQQVKGDLRRLDDVLNYAIDPLLDTEAVEPAAADQAPPRLLSGRIEMRDVSFGYDRLGTPLIVDFNLSIEPGQRVALVGTSGSGKSTVGRLLLGLYTPTSGEIRYDGMPLPLIPRPVFTSSVGSVDQEIQLFSGSVMDNLRMWDSTISEARVVQAAKDACIHDDIAARPGGYHSEVGEAQARFSGGQAQRIEIARALARDPSILVLDEATAALEPITEMLIDRNLRRRGCTCVIVAHRLSTIRDCDEIIVLDRGKIVERGDHDTLVAARGRYFEMVHAQ
jgi:NHLM bacteriocin system ABC transporter peptidase/ATP-binding protein